MLVEYQSNNSGGYWWLGDKDWIKLEEAGWTIEWGGLYFCNDTFGQDKITPYVVKCNKEHCEGHIRFTSHTQMTDKDRWLGCLAREAHKEFDTIGEAIKEFEEVTGQDASDEGCNCCGAPHRFAWDDDYCSGEGCLQYLFPDKEIPSSLREAIERS